MFYLYILYSKSRDRYYVGHSSDISGRYSHKIAISNHRIKAIKSSEVLFAYKNYRNNQPAQMCLNSDEFIRRFALHILPKGFVRIRHFGIGAPTNKKLLASIKTQLLEICLSLNTPLIYPHWEPKL